MDNLWQCNVCGFYQEGGDTCQSCGAAKPLSKAKSPEPYRKPISPPIEKLFLTNKQDAKFLVGKDQRPASLRNTGLGCLLPFLSIFVIAGLFFLGWSVIQLKNHLELNNDGIVTQGRMIDHRIYEDSEGDSYYITYSFVANDQTYSQEQSVSSDLYNRFEAGAPLDIRYLPGNPGKSRIEGEGASPWIPLGFSMCWLSFVMLFLWGAVHQADRNDLLVKKGTLVEGQVVSASSYEDSDNGYSIKLKYSYVSPRDGQTVVRMYDFAARDHKREPLPPQGTPVIILYHSDKHHQVL